MASMGKAPKGMASSGGPKQTGTMPMSSTTAEFKSVMMAREKAHVAARSRHNAIARSHMKPLPESDLDCTGPKGKC